MPWIRQMHKAEQCPSCHTWDKRRQWLHNWAEKFDDTSIGASFVVYDTRKQSLPLEILGSKTSITRSRFLTIPITILYTRPMMSCRHRSIMVKHKNPSIVIPHPSCMCVRWGFKIWPVKNNIVIQELPRKPFLHSIYRHWLIEWLLQTS